MDAKLLQLKPGEHVLEELVQDVFCTAYRGATPGMDAASATLVLSVRSPQTKERSANHPPTTLELHVERDAAMKLLLDLHKLAGELSWPLEKAVVAGDALGPSQVGEPQRPLKGPG